MIYKQIFTFARSTRPLCLGPLELTKVLEYFNWKFFAELDFEIKGFFKNQISSNSTPPRLELERAKKN